MSSVPGLPLMITPYRGSVVQWSRMASQDELVFNQSIWSQGMSECMLERSEMVCDRTSIPNENTWTWIPNLKQYPNLNTHTQVLNLNIQWRPEHEYPNPTLIPKPEYHTEHPTLNTDYWCETEHEYLSVNAPECEFPNLIPHLNTQPWLLTTEPELLNTNTWIWIPNPDYWTEYMSTYLNVNTKHEYLKCENWTWIPKLNTPNLIWTECPTWIVNLMPKHEYPNWLPKWIQILECEYWTWNLNVNATWISKPDTTDLDTQTHLSRNTWTTMSTSKDLQIFIYLIDSTSNTFSFFFKLGMDSTQVSLKNLMHSWITL